MTESESIPIACNLTAKALDNRKPVLQTLLGRASVAEELDDGYLLQFANEAALSGELVAMIEFERICCPFLTFGLGYPAGTATIQLTIRGPEGTKAFLRTEMPQLFDVEMA